MRDMEETPRAIEILISEHDACREQVDRTLTLFGRTGLGDGHFPDGTLEAAEQLLRYLDTDLETHIAKEEGPLFPRLKAALPADDRLIDEMVAEHDLIRMKREDAHAALLSLLDGHEEVRAVRETLQTALANAAQSGRRLAHLGAAIETVSGKLRVHFENEEELVFPLALELLSEEDLTTIAEEMGRLSSTA